LAHRGIFSLKKLFQFENFRVRKLAAINALNLYLSVCVAFLAKCAESKEQLSAEFIAAARPLKQTVSFLFYRVHLVPLYPETGALRRSQTLSTTPNNRSSMLYPSFFYLILRKLKLSRDPPAFSAHTA